MANELRVEPIIVLPCAFLHNEDSQCISRTFAVEAGFKVKR